MIEGVTLGGIETGLHVSGPLKGPAVVGLHSAGLGGASLGALADVLAAAGVRLFAPDLRGHGTSAALPAQVAIDGMVDDVCELIDRWGLTDFRLVGTSMGGVVAGQVAARLDSWSSLTVCSVPDQGYAAFADRATAVVDGMGGHVESTLDRWFTPAQVSAGHPAVEQSRRMLEDMDPGCWDAVWTSFSAVGGWPDLRGRGPVRCATGAEDVSTPTGVVQRVAHRTGGSFDVIGGATHQMIMTHPHEVSDLVLR